MSAERHKPESEVEKLAGGINFFFTCMAVGIVALVLYSLGVHIHDWWVMP
jgi:hypothetical protein